MVRVRALLGNRHRAGNEHDREAGPDGMSRSEIGDAASRQKRVGTVKVVLGVFFFAVLIGLGGCTDDETPPATDYEKWNVVQTLGANSVAVGGIESNSANTGGVLYVYGAGVAVTHHIGLESQAPVGSVGDVFRGGTGDIYVLGSWQAPYSTRLLHYDNTAWSVSGSYEFGGGGGAYWSDGSYTLVGGNGSIYTVTANDTIQVQTDSTDLLWGVAGISKDDYWVVGLAGTILHVLHGELDATYSFSPVRMVGICCLPDGTVYSVGDGGTIVEIAGGVASVDDGSASGDLISVWGCSQDCIYIGGSEGLYRRDGDAWAEVETGKSARYLDVTGSGPDDVFAIAFIESSEEPGRGSNYLLHFDGTRWSEVLRREHDAGKPEKGKAIAAPW